MAMKASIRDGKKRFSVYRTVLSGITRGDHNFFSPLDSLHYSTENESRRWTGDEDIKRREWQLYVSRLPGWHISGLGSGTNHGYLRHGLQLLLLA